MNKITKMLDKALRTLDYTIEEENGVEIRYEGDTYVLYVDGHPVADGSLQRMKQFMKEELRNR